MSSQSPNPPQDLQSAPADLARSERRRARQPRRRALVVFAAIVGLGIAFFVGLAIGRAIEDVPDPGGTQTVVRTLEPSTVRPEPRTVTVVEPNP